MGILTQADVDRIEREVDADIEAAIEAIQNLPERSASGPNLSLAIDGV
jgi:hypothetical protein